MRNIFKRIYDKIIKYREDHSWKRKDHITNINKNIYFIIRRRADNVGLFSYFITMLGGVKYAYDHNYLPVIDMMNYKNSYLEKQFLGQHNSWEFFFTQPYNNVLQNAYKSKNYILSDSIDLNIYDKPDCAVDFFLNKNNAIDKWRNIYNTSIKPSKILQQKIEEEYIKIFKPNEKVLGILARGTDYLSLRPKDHPIQPENDDVIRKARSLIKEYSISKIFLASEDKDIIRKYKNEFGDMILMNERNKINYSGQGLILDDKSARSIDSALEYATTIFLLSKCQCIIGGRTSGSTAAMILSEGFEYSYFWDIGTYE